jgi:hypothetical protein
VDGRAPCVALLGLRDLAGFSFTPHKH